MAEKISNSIRNASCTACSFSQDCKTVCITGEGGATAGLMIIADNPATFDDMNNTVMKSPAAALLDTILFDNIGIKPEEVYKTTLVKCCPQYGKKLSPKEIEACNQYLIKEIQMVQPKVILTLGENSMQALTGYKKISKYRGTVTEKEIAGLKVTVIPTYGTFYVSNSNTHLQSFATDILKAYNLSIGEINKVSDTQIVVCDTMDKVKQAVAYCVQTKTCSFDFETPEIDEKRGTFLPGFYATTLSLSFQAGSAYVIPLEHKDSPFTKPEVMKIMRYVGKHIFENPEVRKIGHNVDYDRHILRIYGVDKMRGRLDDTMLMHSLYDETLKHGLKIIVADYLPKYAGYDDELEGFGWEKVPLPMLCQYNGTDTDMTLRMCTQLESYLLEDEKVYRVYRNLVMAAFNPVFEMEKRGMQIDREFLRGAIREVGGLINKHTTKLREHKIVKRYERSYSETMRVNSIGELENKIEEWCSKHKPGTDTEMKYRQKLSDLKTGKISAYKGINFGSPDQLEALLYDDPNGFRFPTLTRGTGKEIIEDLEDESGFIDGLLIFRTLNKIQSTYLKGLDLRLDDWDKVHSSFLLNGTVSGRLSSRNPNLQNIPNIAKLTDEDAIYAVGLVKKCFVPLEGYVLIQVDYSQAELRIIASFATEEQMIRIYQAGGDIHLATAAAILKLSIAEFKELPPKEQKKWRTRAKAVNFGFIYGMGAAGFKQYAKTNYRVIISMEEAEAYRDAFFAAYPELLNYHKEYIAKAREFGWVRTLFGRRRRTPDIDSQDDFKRGLDERVAINSPVQGTAGEFTILAIALLQHRLDPRVLLCNTVHDSIQFYAPPELVADTMRIIKMTCENLPIEAYFKCKLKHLGMKVDLEHSTKSWKDLEEYTIAA